ncbi:ectopic P granules protein 5 homolog [Anopheles arabiensis]|uniref:Uncharacterized protein n=1 Tax=Anopheles arabiensis TaxID=7173 RepID=A0A499FT84_ANOAR|nr:ectopic P granules protein 5 homolog [Anopheles arabiensis]
MEAAKPRTKKKTSSKKSVKQSTAAKAEEVQESVAADDELVLETEPTVTPTAMAPASPSEEQTACEEVEEATFSNDPEQSIESSAVEETQSYQSQEANEDSQTKEEMGGDFAPTAPPCSVPAVTNLPTTMLYPDLSQLKLEASDGEQTFARLSTTSAQPIERPCISAPRTRTLYLQCIQQMEDTALQTDRVHLDAMEQQFVRSESPHGVAKDPGGYDGDLHMSIQTYRAGYHGYGEIVRERKVAHQQIASLQGRCWDFQQVKFSATGRCDDERAVSVSLKSRVASLNVERFKEAKGTMSSLLDRCLTKEKEALIHLLHTRSMVEKKVSDPPKAGQNPTVALRQKLRIIGNALRTEASGSGCDEGERCEYVQDLRKWFVHVGTNLLGAGSVHDRVWLMFHLLRFPSGIGTWAHVLVHPLPVGGKEASPDLLDGELQAILTLTHVLLRPILERQTFLTPLEEAEGRTAQEKMPVREAGGGGLKAADNFEWVDSDGEESSPDKRVRPIKESDLLALLDQIPFQRLFGAITSRAIRRVVSGDVRQLPTTEMLWLVTLANRLVAVLGEGLSTYGRIARYSHFAQRLALLINDTVKFAGDVLRYYRDTHGPHTSEEVELVQVHFDTLVYGAARCIYAAGVALARHLSTLPFALLSSRACWWMLRCLVQRDFTLGPDFEHESEPPVPHNATATDQFSKALLGQEAAHNLYNVLKPFVDLALARDPSSDKELICTITKTLFEVLVAVDAAELVCAELIIEQIHTIVEKNVFVLSVMLQTLAADGTANPQPTADAWQAKGSRLLDVFSSKRKLVMLWDPTESDVNVMLELLLSYPRAHVYHKLALGLLMYINYGEISGLNVPKALQNRVAYSVVVAFRKNQPPAKANSDATEQSEHESYQERCLFVLLQLRLHALDQPLPIVQQILQDPSSAEVRNVPALEQLPDVKAAVDERCPVACLAAMLTTTIGHWVPVFCQDGVNVLQLLLDHHLDTVVVRCLELISLLFTECSHALLGSERFAALLTQLVQGDVELVWTLPKPSTSTINPQQSDQMLALKLLDQAKVGKVGTMLVSQAVSHWRCGYATPAALVGMWCDWLTQISSWTNSAKVLRLLNVLASVSFGHAEAWNALRDKLAPFFKSFAQAKQKQPGIHSLWSKIIGTEPPLLYGTLPSDCVALALLVFELEHRQLELDTELWPRLLRALKRKESLKLDAALRDVSGGLRTREEDFCPAADSLVYCKLARFLVRVSVEHPLCLAVWQQFFAALLTRVTDVGDPVHGVSDRLYGADTGLMEKVKQTLCRLELHYHSAQDANETAVEMLRLVKAFQLWLLDPDLNRIAMDDPINLPAQYAVPHLQATLQGVQECWPECVNQPALVTLHRLMVERWYALYRVHPAQPLKAQPSEGPAAGKPALAPVEAIQRRLANAYTDPLPVPVVEVRGELQDLRDALAKPAAVRVRRITESLRIVRQHIDKTYWTTKAELEQRRDELFELYRQLYVNEDRQVVKQAKCSVLYCAGAATVKVHTKCATLDKTVQERIDARLRGLEAFLQMAINIPPYIAHHTILLRELWNSLFVDYCAETDQTAVQSLNAIIRTMLRTLLHEVSDANFVPPLTFAVRLSLETYRSELSKLMFEEVGQLFADALEAGHKPSSVIVALLEDGRIPCRPLLQVYGQLVKQKTGSLELTLFVDMFGSKLDLSRWLKEHDVAPDELDQFAKLIVIGLYKARPADTVSPVRSDEQAEQDEKFADILISHLVTLASSKFPDNFGKLLQHTINAYSQWPTLPPVMLLRLLNVLRSRAHHLPELYLGMAEDALHQAHRQFAAANCTEPVLGPELLHHLLVAVTEHFVRQRDAAYPWSGMYRRHGAYIEVLGMLLGMFAHSLLAAGMRDNRIGCVHDNLLPAVYRMFEPWIVPYGADVHAHARPGGYSPTTPYGRTAMAPVIDTARHCNNDKAKWMFGVLLHCVEYAIEQVREAYADTDHCSQILLYFLHWYLEWFVDPRIMISALYVYNTLVLDLPWERLLPSELLLERMHALLEHHSPECHELLACVFVRCRWFGEPFDPLPCWIRRTHAPTLAICVRLAYEPVVRSEERTRTAMVRLLHHFARLVWMPMHVAELTPALDWFVMTADAGFLLREPKVPHRELDDALMLLLEIVTGMRCNEANQLVPGGMYLLKRKLYIGVVVRMLMNAGRAASKVTSGKPQLTAAVLRLVASIAGVLAQLPDECGTGCTDCPRLLEARALMTELLTSVKKWQTENTLSLFVDELIRLLDSDVNSPLLTQCVLESANLLDSQTVPWMRLMESALSHYLCDRPKPEWLRALNIVGYTAISRWQYELLAQHCLPLCLELHFLHHWHVSRGEPVAQLGLVEQLLATLPELKISEPIEYRLYPLWYTLAYALLTVRPEPHAAIRSTIAQFGTVSESSSFWVMGMLKKILGKEKTATERVSATRCLVAYAFAVLLAHAYAARRTGQDAAQLSEPDDYSEATEPFTLAKLLSAPEKRVSRDRIASAAVENLKSVCGASAPKEYLVRIQAIVDTLGVDVEPRQILQQAKDIIVSLDGRAEPFLSTLEEAIVTQR